MGSLREDARDRDWQWVAALTYFGSLTRAQGAPPRVEPPPRVSSYELSNGEAAATGRDACERRHGEAAATGRAACELWGLCARPHAIGIGRGWAWSRSLQARLGRVCSYDLSKSAAALTYF